MTPPTLTDVTIVAQTANSRANTALVLAILALGVALVNSMSTTALLKRG